MARSLEAGPFEASYERADFKRRLETEGEIRGLEASWTRKDGSRLFIRENARLVRSQDGDGVYYEGTVEDVTEQKQAEDELRRRSEEVLLLYEASRAMGETLDLEVLFDKAYQAVTRVMDCSGFYISTFDAEAETIRCAYARHRRHEAGRGRVPRHPARAGRPGDPEPGHPLRRKPVPARLPRLLAHRPHSLPGGRGGRPEGTGAGRRRRGPVGLDGPAQTWKSKVTGVIQVFSARPDAFQADQMRFLEALAPQLAAAMANARLFHRAQAEIRERRQAEQAVRQLSEFNEGIIRNMTEGIVLEDPDETFSFVNPAAAVMLGYQAEELVGRHLSSIIPADQVSVVRAANARRAAGPERSLRAAAPAQGRHTDQRPGQRQPALRGRRLYVGTIAVFTDITELKAANRTIWPAGPR